MYNREKKWKVGKWEKLNTSPYTHVFHHRWPTVVVVGETSEIGCCDDDGRSLGGENPIIHPKRLAKRSMDSLNKPLVVVLC
jgi:hypothetical protein